MRKTDADVPARNDPRDDRDFVTALRKGMDVLTCFGRQHARLTVSEVARLTGLTPASARRSLHTLAQIGYLGSDGKRYWMLPRCLLVAHAYLASRPMPSLAQPLLEALSDRTRESTSVVQLIDSDVIVVARSTGRRSLRMGLSVGSRLPAYCSAGGRVLLAALPPQEAATRVTAMDKLALTPQTVRSTPALLDVLARCREDGYSSSEGELEVGARSLAVPVHDRQGQVVAAMTIGMGLNRMNMVDFRKAYLPMLMSARDQLETRQFNA